MERYSKGEIVWTVSGSHIYECRVVDSTSDEVILAVADTLIDGSKTGEVAILRRRPTLVDRNKDKVVQRATVALPEIPEIPGAPSLMDFM